MEGLLLIKGSKWPLTEISKSSRMADLTEALQFGNHKGVSQKPDLLKKSVSDDICYGYGLVIPRGKIPCMTNACLAPMNIMMQLSWTRNSSHTIKVSNGSWDCQ